MLVEKHLRICLHVYDGFDRVLTLAPSEPLLAEAARYLTSGSMPSFKFTDALLDVLASPGMDKGDRGELVGAAILLRAGDAAMFAHTSANACVASPKRGRRTFILSIIER